MYFETLQDVIHMNGHGAFVWGAYAVSFAVLAGLVLAPVGRIRRFLREESRRLRRDEAMARNAQDPSR
jgi:heme exporter protein D